jgi:hypothetical protein
VQCAILLFYKSIDSTDTACYNGLVCVLLLWLIAGKGRNGCNEKKRYGYDARGDPTEDPLVRFAVDRHEFAANDVQYF